MLDMSNHFGLGTNPFGADTDDVDGASFQRALDELLARLRNGARLVVIEGESGSGRTRLMRKAATRIAGDGRTARLVQHAQLLGTEKDADVIFIDEAQGVNPRELAAHIDGSEQAGARSVVLALGVGGAHALPRAVQPIALAPLSEAESGRFIAEHLKRAGGRAELFTPAAVATIANAAKGAPRRLRLIAGLAMVEAALDGAARVDEVHARATLGRLPNGAAMPAPGPAAEKRKAPEAVRPPTPSRPPSQPLAAPSLKTVKYRQFRHASIQPSPVTRETANHTVARRRRLAPLLAGTAALVTIAFLPFRHMIFPAGRDRVAAKPIVAMRAIPAHRTAIASSIAPVALPGMVRQNGSSANPDIRVAVAQPKRPAIPISRASIPEDTAVASTDRNLARTPDTSAAGVVADRQTPAPTTDDIRVRVFIHHAPGDVAAAAAVARVLGARGWNIAELRPVHVRIDHPSARYFYAGDGAAARELGAELSSRLGEAINVRDMHSYLRPPRPGTLEIWLRTREQAN